MSQPVSQNFTSRAFWATAIVLGSVLALATLYELRLLVVVLIAAVTLASSITPLAAKLEERKIPRWLTVILVYTGMLAIYACMAVLLAPALREQAAQLHDHLPDYFNGLTTWYEDIVSRTGQKPVDLQPGGPQLQQLVVNVVKHTADMTAGALGFLVNTVLVLFLTAYFVVEAKVIWSQLLLWLPKSKRDLVKSLIGPLETRMGGYVRGQLLVSLAVATFLGTGYTILGVKYSLILGLLAGLFNLVPFVGSLLSASIAIIIATNQSLMLGVLTLGLYALEQWTESSFFVPHLLGKEVDLHPLLVLFSILIGAHLMGVLGALVAVPLSSAILCVAQELYLKPLNKDDGDAAASS